MILKDAAGGELKDFLPGSIRGIGNMNEFLTNMWKDSVMRYSISVMLYDDTVLIGGELGEYADYFIEKVWGILDSQDIYRKKVQRIM